MRLTIPLLAIEHWTRNPSTGLAPYSILVSALAASALLAFATASDSIWVGSLETDPDSVHYIAAAQNLLAGRGFKSFGDAPLVSWPPLYPIFIAASAAVGKLVGLDLMGSLRIAHVLVFGFFMAGCGYLLRCYIRSTTGLVIALALVLFQYAVPQVFVLALSEGLFLLLCVYYLIVLTRLIEQPSWSVLLALSVLTSLALLQRYVGVTLLLCSIFALCILVPSLPRPRRIQFMFVHVTLAFAPVGLWMVRNYVATGSFTGERLPAVLTLGEHLTRTLEYIHQWVLLPQRTGPVLPVLHVGLLFVAGIAAWHLYKQYCQRGLQYILGATAARVPLPILLFAVVYTAFLVVWLSVVNQGTVSLPYLLPGYLGLALTSIVILVDIQRLWVRMLIVFWIIVVALPVSLSFFMARAEACCNTPWRQSALIDWMRANVATEVVYANIPIPLYTGLTIRAAPSEAESWSYLQRNEALYVAWFSDVYRDSCDPSSRCYQADYNPTTLDKFFQIEVIAQLPDGSVYRLLPLTEQGTLANSHLKEIKSQSF